MHWTVICVQFAVSDVYDGTGKVVVATFTLNWRHAAFWGIFYCTALTHFKKTLKILIPATHTQYYIAHKMFDSF